MKGIDVSVFQGDIDWNKVKKSGVDYAIIKATQGRGTTNWTKYLYNFTDSKFKTNIVNATKAGVKCGVYHFLCARNEIEAIREADYFIKVITPYKNKIALWAAVDVETGIYLPQGKKELLTSITNVFLNRVKEAGFTPMLYTNKNYLTYHLDYSKLKQWDIWQAWYHKPYSDQMPPKDVDKLCIWQWGTGKVDGIKDDVDLNIFYKDISVKPIPAPKPVQNLTQKEVKAGDKVKIKIGTKIYGTNISLSLWVCIRTYNVISISGDRVVIGIGKAITAAVDIKDVNKL